MDSISTKQIERPINLDWSLGFSCNVANSVHSLKNEERNAIFYISSHTGIIHDLDNNKQHLLQGHRNAISSLAISDDKRWIITGEQGDDAMIIIWDALNGQVRKILTSTDSVAH